MKKLVPVIVVDAIEPVLPFWTDRLGFVRVVEVPHEAHLGFVILQAGNVELMYQSTASAAADLPALAAELRTQRTALYVDVDDLDAVERALAGVEVVVPRRTTFYGAEEVFVRAPCGTVVGFAQQGA